MLIIISTFLPPKKGGNGNASGSVVTASADRIVRMYDVNQGRITADFVGHEGSVKCVDVNMLHPHVIASGGRDGAVCIWDSRTAQVQTKRGREPPLRSGHSPAATYHRPVATYTAAHRDRVTGYAHSTTAVALLNDGRTLLSGGADGEIHRWDLRAKSHTKQRPPTQVATRLPKGQSPRGIASFSLDSTSNNLVVGSIDDAAFLYRGIGSCKGLEDAPEVLKGHTTGAFYYKAALSSDAEYVVSGSSNAAAYVWKVHPTRKSIAPPTPWVLDNPEGRVFSVACHSHAGEKCGNGHPTVAITSQHSARLWSTMSRARAMQARSPRDAYSQAAAAGFAGRQPPLIPRKMVLALDAAAAAAAAAVAKMPPAAGTDGDNVAANGPSSVPEHPATRTTAVASSGNAFAQPSPPPPKRITAAAAAAGARAAAAATDVREGKEVKREPELAWIPSELSMAGEQQSATSPLPPILEPRSHEGADRTPERPSKRPRRANKTNTADLISVPAGGGRESGGMTPASRVARDDLSTQRTLLDYYSRA